jgi:hypothetical protein
MPQGRRCRFCLRRDQQQLLNQVERKNVCGAPPQTALVTRGRGVRKPIDRLLWPLALGAWTYATGSPTPEGLGSIRCAQKAPIRLSGYRHPRTVRTRSSSIIGHIAQNGNGSEWVRGEQPCENSQSSMFWSEVKGQDFCVESGKGNGIAAAPSPKSRTEWCSPSGSSRV